MKNQYVADVNDYRKYGLLRGLSGGGAIRLGVCWMLTPDDGRTDGKFIGYLNDSARWRRFDPELFGCLNGCIATDARSIQQIEASGILPGAVFQSDVLGDGLEDRRRYFAEMHARLGETDLVFFDPDNGLEAQSVAIGRKNSSKYLYWKELAEAYARGHSVLVYQHFIRESRDVFVDRIAARMAEETSAPTMWSFRTENVVFLLAARPEHAEVLQRNATAMGELWDGQIRATEHRPPAHRAQPTSTAEATQSAAMDDTWKAMTWRQLGAAIDMLEKAIEACPEEVWGDRSRGPGFWYIAYHTLFYLDLYSGDGVEGFAPPPPFGLTELEKGLVLPPRAYTRAELQAYLEHGRARARARIDTMTDEKARRRCGFEWVDASEAELLLYNMRHVQHHAAQLYLLLRQTTDSTPGWIRFAS